MSAVSQPRTNPVLRSPAPVITDAPGVQPTLSPIWTPLERLAITRRAPQIMRRHLVRSAVRITVLMTGDAAALLFLRLLLHGLRDSQWLGTATARVLNQL